VKERFFLPCEEWAEKLAALQEDDLSPSDLISLDKHLSSCSACTAVRREYLMISERLAQDVQSNPPIAIPPRLQQRMERLERWEQMSQELADEALPIAREDQNQQKALPGDFNLIDYERVFSSPNWLPFRHYQQMPEENSQSSQ
jgi:hypothetical protein